MSYLLDTIDFIWWNEESARLPRPARFQHLRPALPRPPGGGLLDHRVDIGAVAAILGRASATTPLRYDRRG